MPIVSNALSLIRAPLAFVFLQQDPFLRMVAVFLAMLTDSIDGYIARKTHSTSLFGAIIDPLMDKFFVYFALLVFLQENALPLWACLAMVSRDFFLIAHGAYLHYSNKWKTYKFQSVRFGKITTALQFLVLGGLTLGYTFPQGLYMIFIVFGIFAFMELLAISVKASTST